MNLKHHNIDKFKWTKKKSCTYSPSHSETTKHPYSAIFSPHSEDTNSPISVSYTINPYQIFSSTNNKSKNNQEIICNTSNTINKTLSKTRRTRHKHSHHSANSSGASVQLSETPLTPTPEQDITFNFWW